ncbi:MAG: hypothetical protein C4524_09410 [Candidatus Zixiibacteriota bacterium]|nr:MAG: hypothetical protein C4524_09410 [candidate division Zixibacteria bacterium]
MPLRKPCISFFLLLLILAAGGGCSRPSDQTLRLVYSGAMMGYLEPCGCREGRVGGLARLSAAARDSLDLWPEPKLLLEAGDFAEAFASPGVDPKNRYLLQAMSFLGYDAVNVTAQDLMAGVETLRWAADSLRVPLISANLASKNGGLVFPGWVIRQAGDLTIGVVGLGAVRPLEMHRARVDSLEFTAPEPALRRALDQVRPQCDRVILLTDLTSRATREIARTIPEIDLVISTMELTPTQGLRRVGQAWVAGTSRQGKAITTIGLTPVTEDSLAATFSKALLDSTYRDDPRVARLISEYQALRARHPGGWFSGGDPEASE